MIKAVRTLIYRALHFLSVVKKFYSFFFTSIRLMIRRKLWTFAKINAIFIIHIFWLFNGQILVSQNKSKQ